MGLITAILIDFSSLEDKPSKPKLVFKVSLSIS